MNEIKFDADVIIVGAGPAGLTAAKYLERANKSYLLFEKECVGGQLAECPLIENFPGYIGTGAELVESMEEKLYGEVVYDEVCDVDYDSFYNVTIKTTSGKLYRSKAIIWATGAKYIELKTETSGDVKKFIHYCVVCDGALYKNKEVAVVGDANSAAQYALTLAETNKVSLIALTDKLFCEDALLLRLQSNKNIKIFYNFNTSKISKVSDDSVKLESTKGEDVTVNGIFVAIGQKPNNSSLPQMMIDSRGYVSSKADCCSTCIPSIFVAGDCRSKTYRQAVMACSDGANAALAAIKYLNI